MMDELFLKIVNMSIAASCIVLAVLILRLVLKKAPKWVNVLLWGIVAVRLICPTFIQSNVSLVPHTQWVEQYSSDSEDTLSSHPLTPDEITVTELEENVTVTYVENSTPLEVHKSMSTISVFAYLWAIGMAIMLLYMAVSFIRLHGKVASAVLLHDNVYQSEFIVAPFVLGMVKPKIYIPFGLNENALAHILAHEKAHIRRLDHLWKPLGFLLLSVHWFNPLVWLGYILLCRDIEAACDERVIRTLGQNERADYSEALLRCSVSRRMISACPLAFGEVSVKERVKNVLCYKKPAVWIIGLAVLACAVCAVCFLTDPESSEEIPQRPLEELYMGYTPEEAAADGCVVLDGMDLISGERIWNEFVNATKANKPATVRVYQYYSDQAYVYYLKELSYDGNTFRLCFYNWTGDTKERFLDEDEYKYLVRSAYEINGNFYEYYLLADSPNVTAEGYWSSLVSSVYRPEYNIYNRCHPIYTVKLSDVPFSKDYSDVYLDSYYGKAYFDLDGDGKEETLSLGLGRTSGLFTFTLTVTEKGLLEYENIFCTEFYNLCFISENGVVKVQGTTQDDPPEIHIFDISVEDGTVHLSENGTPLPSFGNGYLREDEPADSTATEMELLFTGLIRGWSMNPPRDGTSGTVTFDSVEVISPGDTASIAQMQLSEADRVNGYYIYNEESLASTIVMLPEGSLFRFMDRTGIFGDKDDSRYTVEYGWVTTTDAEVFMTYLKTYREPLADADDLPPILFGFAEWNGKLFVTELCFGE